MRENRGMHLLDLTLSTAAENIALDEALLEAAEDGQRGETLRLWSPTQPMVVIGRASKIADEVNREYCLRNDIPILRRCSGGASIVAAPGCLMYAVVLNCELRPDLRMIDRAHQFVLERVAAAMNAVAPAGPVKLAGTSDLAVDDRKVAGNSLRCKRDWLLYHGTILCEADLALISHCLNTAPRQPEYRNNRSHADFVANFGGDIDRLKSSLVTTWGAEEGIGWPRERTAALVAEKYAQSEWNERI